MIYTNKGRTIRNPGRGGENSPKKIRPKKNVWKKNSCSHYVREKKFVQANSKVQIVLKKIRAEVKCIEKKSCRDMRLKKNSCRKKFIPPPPPGISNGPPLTLEEVMSDWSVRNYDEIC
jgi:hypothetical protein